MSLYASSILLAQESDGETLFDTLRMIDSQLSNEFLGFRFLGVNIIHYLFVLKQVRIIETLRSPIGFVRALYADLVDMVIVSGQSSFALTICVSFDLPRPQISPMKI